jgi:hypothetical protein
VKRHAEPWAVDLSIEAAQVVTLMLGKSAVKREDLRAGQDQLAVRGRRSSLCVDRRVFQHIETKETTMSVPVVKITLVDPTVPERQFVFDRPRTCVVGRQYDCDISLPSDRAHREVSRHHCQLDINPPHVRVRDLNSRNGTYVNGKRLSPQATASDSSGCCDPGTAVLSDGDEIRIAKSRFHVHVEENLEQFTTDTPSAYGIA